MKTLKKTPVSVLFLFATLSLFGQKPELVLPTLHTDAISDISFSADGKYLASCAGKEIKFWDLASGRLLRTILSPTPLNHIALSKDGTRLVSGSYCGMNVGYPEGPADLNTDVRVWDMITGKPLRTLKSYGRPVCLLEVGISPDMQYAFAYAMGNTLGLGKISIWDINTGKEQITLPAGPDEEYASISFSADSKHLLMQVGSIHGVSDSSDVLQWVDWSTGKTENIIEEHCKAVGNVGDEVIAFTESGWLKRWNSRDKSRPADRKIDISMDDENDLVIHGEYKFSEDGTRLSRKSLSTIDLGPITVDGEVYQDRGDFLRFRNYDTQSGALISDRISKKRVTSGYTAGDLSPDLGLYIDCPRAPEFRALDALLTGMKAYSTGSGAFSHAFGLTSLETTIVANSSGNELVGQVFDQGKLLTIRRDTIITTPFNRYNTIFLSEKGTVITGVEKDSLSFFSTDHSPTLDKRWKLECKDGLTYQLTDTRSGQVVASLLLNDSEPTALSEEGRMGEVWADAISNTWAVTTPSGLFDASPDMMKSLHYVSGMEIIDLDQLKERYYEPGLLAKILGLSQESVRSVEAFNNVALYPEMSAELGADKRSLQVALKPRNGGIGKLSVFVNGKEVQEDANPQRAQNLTIDLSAYAAYYLPDAPSKLALRVYNQAGWLKSAALELDYQLPPTARGSDTNPAAPVKPLSKQKPGLYAIVVGTANYAGDKLDLQYADHDASSFSQALRTSAAKIFGERVSVTLLNTDAADATRQAESNKTSIGKAFAEVAAKAGAQDVLVVYLSGHGVNYGTAETGQFYYLTKDIASENLSDPEVRKNYAISSAELTEWIKAIPALKQVMILDACNSGKIVEDLAAGRKDLNSSQVRALDRMKDRTGMFILTGSAADKVSYEASQYGQGLLTYSILQGMSGLALTDDKRVDVMTLFQYSRDRVPELAKGIGGVQTPVLAFPVSGASFDIGLVDASVKIPVSQAKPVFIRNNFQDEDAFDDVLGLTPALAEYFRKLSLKGAQADMLYVDVSEYENAWSMKGRYSIKGEDVRVRGKLFKGKEMKGEFEVTGQKSDVPGLVTAIIGKVSGMVK